MDARALWYQVSTEDRMIHPDNKTIEIAASHGLLASQATAVSDLIHEAAGVA